MKFVSMKWKLSASFVLLTMSFIAIYVFVAKRTFEEDKISYVLETQQKEITTHAQLFRSRILRLLFEAKAILAGGEESTRALFQKHESLLAIVVEQDGKSLLRLAQDGIDASVLDPIAPVGGKPRLEIIGSDYFALATEEATNDGKLVYRILFKTDSPLPAESAGSAFALLREEPGKFSVIRASPGARFAPAELEKFLSSIDEGPANRTLVAEIGGATYFASLADAGLGDFRFASLVEQSRAMGALQVLFRRSLVFVLFSTFATIILALILSKSLTMNINALTEMAGAVGKGNFDVSPGFDARDEIGILAGAFRKMTAEIRRLIQDSVEKTRMEAELQTTRLVQGSLFPAKPDHVTKHVRIAGAYRTSTECGGDWWYYFRRGEKLYVLVADATGHGTPAALVTAAARSVFTVVEESDMSLEEMARAWDRAVKRCSNGRIFMTALLLVIDVETGSGQMLSASHEQPILIQPTKEGATSADFFPTTLNGTLGEQVAEWKTDAFTMNPGERLLLFTDGLFAIEDANGQPMNERRFLRFLEKECTPGRSARSLVDAIEAKISATTGDRALPDDISIVLIERV